MDSYKRSFLKLSFWLMTIIIALISLSDPILFCDNTFAAISDDQEADRMKLALLVGIDDYPYVTKLKGAVNDVEAMKELLVERFGFPDDEYHIVELTNQKATRDKILQSIQKHLLDKARSNSIVVFHYSGHGSQIRDRSDDEIDNWDETIVPYDSGHKKPHPNRDITDDELLDLLDQLTKKTPYVTFIFDSCHSGTVSRAAGLPRQIERDERPLSDSNSAAKSTTRGVYEGKSGLHPVNSRHTVISASTSAESAYEMNVDGNHYGTLTWYLIEQLRLAGQESTYQDIMDRVRMAVTAKYWAQHPQLEGAGEDQLVFGTRSLPSKSYIPVKSNPDGTVTLSAGQVQSITKGSTYNVYLSGTKSFEENVQSIARIEITGVETNFSKGKIIQGGPVSDASRAVEHEHHWPNPVLRIYFMFEDPNTRRLVPSPTLKIIRKELANFKHIAIIPAPSGYDLLLREQHDPQTGMRYIVTEGGDPTEISPRVPVDDPRSVDIVVEQVTHWAKWFNILQINNNNPSLNLDFTLKSHRAAESREGPADREINLSLLLGEEFTIQIKNRSHKDVYIALLDLSSDGSVYLVFPKSGEQEFMEPGKILEKTLKTTLPEKKDRIRDVLKLVATTSYADFRFLKQSAVKGGQKLADTRGKLANPLEELLAGAAMGSTRGVETVEVGNWSTIDRVLEVRRK